MNKVSTYVKGAGRPNGVATGINWRDVDMHSEAGRKALSEAITGYFTDVRKAMLAQQMAAKTTRAGHLTLPRGVDLAANVYGVQADFGVMSMFRFADKSASKNPTMQVANVNGGAVVFEQKEAGKPANIRRVNTATPATLSSVTWHGALGIDDDARRFDEYDVYEQSVQQVPDLWMDHWASTLSALFVALGAGVNESWSTNLITTLNNAGAQIVEDCGDTYGVPDRPQLMLYANHRRWDLVQQALASNYSMANDNNSAQELQWDIVPIFTRKISTASMYLALPGYDMVDAEWDPLYSEFGRDFERGVDAQVWRTRRNAGILNTAQVRRITPA